jgi:ATP-dependent helicase/nuclease subunit B
MAISRFKLETLAASIDANATILVPSLRIKDAILAQYHASQANKTYLTPDVVPIDVWVKDQWDKLAFAGVSPFCDIQVLAGAEELFIWTSIVEASRDQLPLLNPTDTAAGISQSYQDAKQWGLWQHIQSDSQHYAGNPDVAVFKQWSLAFQDYCAQRSLIGLVDSIQCLIESYLGGNRLFLPHAITLSNFDNPPPLYAKLFKAMGGITSITFSELPKPDTQVEIQRYQFETRTDEIRACAQWAKKIAAENPDDHIGIITPATLSDANTIKRYFNDSFRATQILEFAAVEPLFNSASTDQALSDEAFVNDAIQFLSSFWRDANSQDICRLLRSDYVLPNTDEASSRMQAELLMRQRFSTTCAQFELSEILDNSQLPSHSPELARALLNCRTIIRQAATTATPKQAVALFRTLLEEIQWPGERLSAGQKKALQAWDDCLDQFSSFNKSAGSAPYPVLLGRLKQLIANTALRSGFSSRRQISAYTVAEAQGLRFDRVWLLGFDDQSWPPSASPSPFLPYELQRRYQLPGAHAEIQLAMANASMLALKSAVSKQLVVSYFASEGDQQFRPSRLFHEPPLETINSSASWPLNTYSEARKGQARCVQTDDLAPPVLDKEEIIKGGQSVISNQSSCPFRAFAIHRLNITPLEGFSRGLNSMARGIAIHIGLEHLYKNFENLESITKLSDDEILPLVGNAAGEAVSYLQKNYKRVMTPRFTELEKMRIDGLLSLFLEVDRGRVSFSILEQEKKYIWQHGELTLTIKVDRIDKLDNGALALIDYKTGKSAPRRESWLDARPEDMQLPFYFAVASAQENSTVEALAIAHVNIEKLQYSALAAKGNFTEKLTPVGDDPSFNLTWDELTAAWQQRVTHMADEFIAGAATVDPVNGVKTCLYCKLKPLCRINELGSTLWLDEEDFAAAADVINEGDY